MENYKKGVDSLVYAVCGSGKTEICLALIKYTLNCGEKVAFSLPRRDVAIELYNRLKDIFAKNSVVCVYGGHTEIKQGDIVVLTTHQLYRYKDYFHLIILDEIDAFPFKNDPVLHSMFYQALCGHYVMMSATPSKEVIKHFSGSNKDILRLDVRYHGHPLPVPKIIKLNRVFQKLYLIRKLIQYRNKKKQVFVFTPTIEICERLYRFISMFVKGGNYVHSKREHRKEIINQFRKGMFHFLITTSVLERGVTVKNLQVIVNQTDHKIYEEGTLIQIAGRVGRKKDAPNGDVIFLCEKVTDDIKKSIENIKENNRVLYG